VRAAASTRRESHPPRPWGLVLLALALVLLAGAFGLGVEPVGDSSAWALTAVVLAVLGFAATTPWLAYVMSGSVGRRTDDAATLLAARRIRHDHGAAGRAAAAVGAIGLTMGVLGVFVSDLLVEQDSVDVGYYLGPAVLVGLLAVLALAVVTLSLSLHSIEATLDRRREMSALVATGVPARTIEEANRVECQLVTLPITLIAALAGALPYLLVSPAAGPLSLGGLAGVVLAGAGVWLAVRLAARVTRPWLRAAVAAGNLRTE